MRNKLTPAKTPLPKFASDKEAAEYFEKHSVAGIWDQLPEARLNVSRQAVIKTLLGRALEQKRAGKPRAKRKAG